MFDAIRPTAIYALSGPDGRVRYVGMTVEPPKRLRRHIWEARSGHGDGHRDRWVRTLISAGATPTMRVLEVVPSDEAAAAEVRWIARFLAEGAELTNVTSGGEGRRGPHQPETKERIRAALMGHPVTAAAREAVRAHSLGNTYSVGRHQTPETTEKLRQAALRQAHPRGYKQSDEARANMRAGAKHRPPQSDDTRAKRRDLMLGNRHAARKAP